MPLGAGMDRLLLVPTLRPENKPLSAAHACTGTRADINVASVASADHFLNLSVNIAVFPFLYLVNYMPADCADGTNSYL